MNGPYYNLYRITATLKVETDITANISTSPIGRSGIFVIMSAEAFRLTKKLAHASYELT